MRRAFSKINSLAFLSVLSFSAISRNRRPAASASDGPADAAITHDAADLLFEHLAARDEGKFARLFDEREPPLSEIDMPFDDAFDVVSVAAFDKIETEFACQLPGDPQQFASAQCVEHIGRWLPQPQLVLVAKTMRHEPLSSLRESRVHFIAKSYVVNRYRSIAHQFLIEPSGTVKLALGIE